MNANSRFTVAIHIMTMLAYGREQRLTSEFISRSVTTNPVVIRRIMGELRRAGLVSSHAGSGGGWQLTKAPEQISLRDIYLAVKEGPLFPPPHSKPNPQCCIGRTILRAVQDVFDDAESVLEQQFAQITVADVLAKSLAGETLAR